MTDLRWGKNEDLLATRGETLKASFEVLNNDETPVDLSGWAVTMYFSAAAKDDDDKAKQTATLSSGLSVSGDDNNVIDVSFLLTHKDVKSYNIKIVSPDQLLTLRPYYGKVTYTEP